MKKKKEPDRTLCENFCSYYKPDRNEDLACEGFRVVHRLIERGKNVPLAGHGTERRHAMSAGALRDAMCGSCAFHDEDCDFILTGGSAAPCGGFVLLHRLLDSGEITIEEIKRR